MCSDLLTRDKNPLSRPTASAGDLSHFGPTDCTEEHAEAVAKYVRASLAENTRRAYRFDLAHFTDWGGKIPATDATVAFYLAAHGETLAVATLARRLTAI